MGILARENIFSSNDKEIVKNKKKEVVIYQHNIVSRLATIGRC